MSDSVQLQVKLKMEMLLAEKEFYLAQNRLAEWNSLPPVYIEELNVIKEELSKLLGGLK